MMSKEKIEERRFLIALRLFAEYSSVRSAVARGCGHTNTTVRDNK